MMNTQLAGISLNSYVYNASGINNQVLSQLEKIANSESAAIVLKSATQEPRKGNDNPKYIVKSPLIPGGTFNSMGLPNEGIEKTLEFVASLKAKYNKPVIISLSGLSSEENINLIKQTQKQGLADLIELNLSCPNLIGKPLVGYDMAQAEDLFKQIQDLGNIPLGVKLPPYLDLPYFDQMSELLLKYQIKYIVCINTLGNCLLVDGEKETTLIKPKNGLGGLGGDWLKPIALGNVNNFYRRIGDKIDIVGVGGVRTGMDAFEFLLSGASAVQVGTSFAHEGLEIFSKINKELEEILQRKNYTSIDSAKGKLKYL